MPTAMSQMPDHAMDEPGAGEGLPFRAAAPAAPEPLEESEVSTGRWAVARLEIVSGDARTTAVIPGGGQSIVIGTSRGADLRLRDPTASRRHCRIWRVADRVWIEDLGSRHGTQVNRASITVPYPLRHGDVIRVGRSTIRYVSFHDLLLEGEAANASQSEPHADAAQDEPSQAPAISRGPAEAGWPARIGRGLRMRWMQIAAGAVACAVALLILQSIRTALGYAAGQMP